VNPEGLLKEGKKERGASSLEIFCQNPPIWEVQMGGYGLL